MAGLDKPSSGRILLNDVDVTGLGIRKRNVAMVYQQFINYPAMTVYENIASPLRVKGLATSEIDKKVREAARLLRLELMLDRLPLQLSGGQQQRTAIARALVKQADLVLMDEPLANLDYKLREELREELPRDFCLCHHRTLRGADVGRLHRRALQTPRDAIRADKCGLSQPA